MSEPRVSIETVLTSELGFGLKTATPCQRAICRVLDGQKLGRLASVPAVIQMFGGTAPTEKPSQFLTVSGIRTAKSLIAACFALVRARYVDISSISSAEMQPILPITSIRKHNSKVILGHIKELYHQGRLKHWFAEEPTDTEVKIRNVSGKKRVVTIMLIAGQRSAGNLQSYWMTSGVVDEVFLMRSEDEAVINLEDVVKSLRGRIIEGGQLLFVGSPWAAEGPGYGIYQQYFGKPSTVACVAHASGPAMNPVHWSEKRVNELRDSPVQTDRDAYVMTCLGQFLTASYGLITEAHLNQCCHGREELPPDEGIKYYAVADPATRRNAWTLVIGHRGADGQLYVDYADERVPESGRPLDSATVLKEMVIPQMRRYGITQIASDMWASDVLASLLSTLEPGFKWYYQTGYNAQVQYQLRRLVDGLRAGGHFRINNHAQLREDLKQIRRKVGAGSEGKFELAKTADGRHADFAAALCLLDYIATDASYSNMSWPSGFFRETRKAASDDEMLKLGVMFPWDVDSLFRRTETVL